MIDRKRMPDCPVATTVLLVGSKWRLLILRDLMAGTKRFNQLYHGLENISQKVLTENLKAMEEEGIIARKVYPEIPPKVEYSLTELGLKMKPIIDSMATWGNYYRAARARDKESIAN